MAIYDVKSPDGTEFEIEAPDDANEDDVISYAQSNFDKAKTAPPALDQTQPESSENIKKSIKTQKGRIGAGAEQWMQGMTGGFIDEGQDALGALLATAMNNPKALTDPNAMTPELAESLSGAYDTTQQRLQKEREDYPVTSTIANIGGGLQTALAGGEAMPGVATGLSKLPAWLSAPAVGAGTASLYAAGEAPQGEKGDAAIDAIIPGAVLGIAGHGAVKGAEKTLGPLTKKVMDKLSRRKAAAGKSVQDLAQESEDLATNATSQNSLAESGPAFDLVKRKLQKDFPNNYEGALEAYRNGPEAMIELYGNQTRTLAKGAAQYPAGKAAADKYFEDRTGTAVENMKQAVSKNVSPVQNYFATVDDVLEKGRAKAAPLYDEAFKGNPSVMSARLNRILEQPAAKQALRDTAQSFQNANERLAVPDKELSETARELAGFGKIKAIKGGVASGLKLKTLDEVKKRIDMMARDAKRKADMGTGTSKEYQDINALRADFVNELDALDVTAKAGPNSLKPEGGKYAKARKTSGDYIRTEQAMDEGMAFHKLDPEQLAKRMGDLSDNEKEAFKIGVGKSIRDVIDNKLEGSNPYNAILGRGAQKDRLLKVLDLKEYHALEKSLRAEDRIFRMRNEILGGSPTTSKSVAAAEIAAGGAQALQAMTTGNFSSVPRQATAAFIKKMFDGINDKTAGKISEILYETNPVKKLAIIDRLGAQNSGMTKQQQALVRKTYFQTENILKQAKTAGAMAGGQMSFTPRTPPVERKGLEGPPPQVNLPVLNNEQFGAPQ